MVNNPPAIQETGVQSLGQEDPLGKGMTTLSSILAWRIPWTKRSLVGYSPWGYKESDTTEWLSLFSLYLIFVLMCFLNPWVITYVCFLFFAFERFLNFLCPWRGLVYMTHNVPLQHVDCLELKTMVIPQIQGKLFTSPLIAEKNVGRGLTAGR